MAAEDAQDLFFQIFNAGIPVVSVTNVNCTAHTADVTYAPGATAPQIAAGNAIVAAYDCHRAEAEIMLDNNGSALLRLMRAVAAVIVDELNVLRDDVIGVASQTWNPASMANATGVTSPNFTVTGAAFGDLVDPVAPYTLAGVTATAYVSAANTCVIRLHNGTGAAVDLASGTWTVIVRRHQALAPRTLAQAKTAIKNQLSSGAAD